MSKKASLILILLFNVIIVISCSPKEKEAEFEWGNLKNMGPNINSPYKDEHINFTPDGKTAIFASIRKEGMGNYDLYMSKFIDGKWTQAELLPPPLNTEKNEFDPFITPDGTKLFFATNRENSDKYYDCDIWLSEWEGDNWGEPKLYDFVFSTSKLPDWGVAVAKDFNTLIFSSGRTPAKSRMVQIFQSIKSGEKWSEPSALPAPVNSGTWEATPYITPDGKTLYLNSGREGKKDVDIWKFEFIDGKWTNPQLMKGPFLSDKHDYDPCISPDGTKFYFTSDREGTLGGSDIWVVEKILKK